MFKIDVLKYLAKLSGKHLCWRFFLIKLQFSVKKKLQHRFFPVNFGRYLKAPFKHNTSERLLKACVRYFLSNFHFSLIDNPSKTTKNFFYFIEKTIFVLEIFKFLYFRLSLFFVPVSRCFRDCSKIKS